MKDPAEEEDSETGTSRGRSSGGRLDPEDWERFRDTAHRALEELIDYLEDVRDRPVWQPVPERVTRRVGDSPPRRPSALEEVWKDFRDSVLPYPVGNIHPRFFGWVHGTGTPSGVLAEMAAATMNSNVGGRDHGAVYVERQVVDWWRQLFGMPEGTSGVLTTGTSMANLVGLSVARNVALERDPRLDGVGADGERLRLYCSAETHGSVTKALEVLGLGRRAVVEIQPDDRFRVNVEALERRVEEDRAEGLEPFCVVGNAGTVNTAAVDDLEALADVCQRHGLWYHVDGAFGGLAILADGLRSRLGGIERADSLAFDFHKWVHVPYDAGCVLVRDEDAHRASFEGRDVYLSREGEGIGGGDLWFTDYGIELSRGFRALKVWMTMRRHGVERIGEAIAENCRQARYLADRIRERDELEMLAPVSLNIVCFRYLGSDPDTGDTSDALNELNRRLLQALHLEGTAAPSSTILEGLLALRVCITNHRTRTEDLDLLVDRVLTLGQELETG